EIRAEQSEVVESPLSGCARVDPREPDDRREHQQAARLREDEELDRRVNAVLVPPDGDQEVHRHEHHFPEEEEQEQIERDEDADDAGDRPEQIRVEEPDALADLGPRAHDRDDSQEQRQRDHQQAEPVHRDVEVDAEARNPGTRGLDQPARAHRRVDRGRVQPDRREQREIGAEREQRDPAAEPRALPLAEPRQRACDERDDDEPREDHRSSATASTITSPASTPAAYQRRATDCPPPAPPHAARRPAANPQYTPSTGSPRSAAATATKGLTKIASYARSKPQPDAQSRSSAAGHGARSRTAGALTRPPCGKNSR